MENKKKDHLLNQDELELRSQQLDPEHPNYWKSRGYPDRPANWKEILEKETKKGGQDGK